MSEAVVLPIGRTQFFDNEGLPLALGSVHYYIPGTDTDKDTWQDPDKNALNTNPVALDASGTALIFGDGDYRMVVFDANGVQLFDGYTEGVTQADATGTGGFGPQEQITAASTTNLGSIASHNAMIVGATTIGSFGNSASLAAPIYYCEVDTGLTLSNSADLQVPGGRDRTLGVGDAFLTEFLGSGQWKIISIWPKRGLNTGFGPRVSVAAADATTIGGINENFVLITGNDAIAGFGNGGLTSRPIFLTKFSGTPTLTHGANFALPSGLNISVVANDYALWEFLGASQWRMIAYFRATGAPLWSVSPVLQSFYSEAAAAFDYTIPAGVTTSTRFRITICAGGGGGGASNAGNTNGGSGGGAGAYWQGIIYGFASGQHITGLVGANGIGVVDAAGTAGALSKITYGGHDLITCAGGLGGARSGGAAGSGGGITRDMTGVTLESEIAVGGGNGGVGGYAGSDINWNGNGGGSFCGMGGGTRIANSGTATLLAGLDASGRGAGGSGSVGGAGIKGGDGTKGFVAIELLTLSNGL